MGGVEGQSEYLVEMFKIFVLLRKITFCGRNFDHSVSRLKVLMRIDGGFSPEGV